MNEQCGHWPLRLDVTADLYVCRCGLRRLDAFDVMAEQRRRELGPLAGFPKVVIVERGHPDAHLGAVDE